MARDPETDQKLPDPQNFAHWLASEVPEFNAELSEAKQALSVECENNARATAPRVVKGSMTITINFAIDDRGACAITPDLRVKHPPRVRGVSRFYVDKGNLTRVDPNAKALPLFEVRGGREEPREAAGGRAVKPG